MKDAFLKINLESHLEIETILSSFNHRLSYLLEQSFLFELNQRASYSEKGLASHDLIN